jgi:CRISPR-associated protein Csc2
LNAIQETTAGGIAGSAYASRENVLPQVFIPTVETLLDVTRDEFIYVLGNILKTTRYGAESNREGFVRNHVLGIYFSDVEIFSNLELTQMFYDALAKDGVVSEYLSLENFTAVYPTIAQTCVDKACGVVKTTTDTERADLLAGVNALYSDEASLVAFLKALDAASVAYAGTKGKEQPADSGE